MGASRPNISSILLLLNQSPGTTQLLGNIPGDACEGQMTFVKETTGDTVYIGLKGKKPTPSNYDIKLTDTRSSFSEDGLVIGDVNAIASAATSQISMYISYRMKNER